MTITLMDIGLWSALLVSITILILRLKSPKENILISLLLVLLMLTRPESILWSLVFIVTGFAKILILFSYKDALKFAKVPFITYLSTLGTLTIFRVYYFGYPFPNTYYAKVSPSIIYNFVQGIKYFIHYSLSSVLVFLAILCLCFYIGWIIIQFYKKSSVRLFLTPQILNFFFLIIITLAGLFIPIINGGDHFASYRFYQAIYPILILNISYLYFQFFSYQNLTHFFSKDKIRYLCVLIILVLISFHVFDWSNIPANSGMMHEFVIAKEGRIVGIMMNNFFSRLPKYPKVGVIIAGGIKFTYKAEIFDLMGLNHVAMGHSKGDRRGIKNHAAFEKDVFFLYPPEIVVPTIESSRQNFRKSIQLWSNQVLKGLYDDKKFQELYQYARVSTESSNNQAISGFFLKDFLDLLSKDPFFYIKIGKF